VSDEARDSADFIGSLLHPSSLSAQSSVALATRADGAWDERTYAELDRQSAQVRTWLSQHGVNVGHRVGLLGDSGGDWAAGFLGILRHGGVVVPFDSTLTVDELDRLWTRTPLAALLVSRRHLGSIEELPASLREHVSVLVREDIAATRREDGADTHRSLDDVAMIVWTAGTAGSAKGACLTFRNLEYVVSQSIVESGATADDRWLSVLPLNHMLELSCGLLACLRTGATMAFPRSHMPNEIVDAMLERRVTRMMVVPVLLRLLYPTLVRNPEVRQRLRALFSGGAPLSPELLQRYRELGVPVFQGYGLTEFSPVVSMNSAKSNRPGSVGKPLPGTEVRISHGEILVRSPGLMTGYLADPESTSRALDDDGWFHTGDLGELDDDGYLYVTGRAKNLVVLESGKKVSPEEVEAELDRSELFVEVCVVPLPIDPLANGGPESVCAVVVPTAEVRARVSDHALTEAVEAEVRRCSQSLSGYKRPTVVEIRHTPLPKTAKMSLRRAEVLASVRESRECR